MPVPTSLTDLSTTPGSNSPASTDTLSNADDYLRAQASIIKRVTTGVDAMTSPDINGGTIDGTTQASGTINGPIAAGGTWTAASTWTLPAHVLAGNVTSTGNPSLNIGTGALTAGAITASGNISTIALGADGAGIFGTNGAGGAVVSLTRRDVLGTRSGLLSSYGNVGVEVGATTGAGTGSTVGTFSSTGLSLGPLGLTAGAGTFSGASIFSGALTAHQTSAAAVAFNSGYTEVRSYGAVGTQGGFKLLSGTGGSAPSTYVEVSPSGNLGLGVTPSAWDSTGRAIETIGGGLYGYGTGQNLLTQNSIFDGAWKYKNTAAASYYQQSGGVHAWYAAPSGTAGNAITFTQAMTLDASGNLILNDTTLSGIATKALFKSTSSTTTELNLWNSAASGTRYHMEFRDGAGATVRGNITSDGANTTYSTSSDYRLKENQALLIGSGQFIDALTPKTWTWKDSGKTGVGFIAHEAQVIAPLSVVGEKDAEDENGNPIYQSMQAGSAEIIANIVAELQSVRARLAALEGAA